MLRDSGVGCFVGNVYVGALAYANDIALLAPTARVMRQLPCICDQYSKKFSVMFNASKSAWLFVSKSKQLCPSVPQVVIGGNRINLASEYTHLGHVISANLDDRSEILSRRNSRCVAR